MAKILILGAGAMGSAFSVPSLERQHEVIIAGTHLDEFPLLLLHVDVQVTVLRKPIPLRQRLKLEFLP